MVKDEVGTFSLLGFFLKQMTYFKGKKNGSTLQHYQVPEIHNASTNGLNLVQIPSFPPFIFF